MANMLDDWFDQFKCSASDSSRPARGRYDPVTGQTLFTAETKKAIRLAKENAKYLQDPLPLNQMHTVIPPNPNAAHQLNEHMFHRGESSLESFHLMLAHFGNCGMRTSLADNLNLTGTARHNLAARHKQRLTSLTQGSRKKIPDSFESIVSFFNHSELAHINSMATAARASPHDVPFKGVESLPADDGERFFSECITWLKGAKAKCDLTSRCFCQVCHTSTGPSQQQQQQMQPQKPTNEETQIQTVVQPERLPEHINNKPTAAKNNFIANSVHQVPNGEHPKQQVEMRPAKQPAQQQQQPQPWQYQMIQPHPLQSAPHPPWMGWGTLHQCHSSHPTHPG